MSPLAILAKITKRRPHIALHLGAHTQWWTLVAANGETLAHSEIYYSTTNARRAATAAAKDLGLSVREVRR